MTTPETPAAPKPLAAILAAMQQEQGDYWFDITPDWLQGRSCFGGLQAALATAALRSELGNALPLRTLQVTFLAPVPVGRLRIQASLLRAGKNVTHAEARLWAGEQLCCIVIGVYGAARTSTVNVPAAQVPPPERRPEDSLATPRMPGIIPEFLQHFEMRWADGQPPFSGAKTSVTKLWLRHLNPSGNAECDLVALADVLPSPALSMVKGFAPASSLTWTLELLEPAAPQGEGYWRVDNAVVAAQDGYVQQSTTLHAPDGRTVALARQVVVIFG
jgi:acyl-CoA thioesterase